MSYTNTAQLGLEHKEWISKLDFYIEELHIMENRLTEVATKNSSIEARAGMEHFQNQFIVQKNNIDELKHKIKEEAHLAFNDASQHAGRVEEHRIEEYKTMGAEIKDFEKVVNELRHEFNQYLSKWM